MDIGVSETKSEESVLELVIQILWTDRNWPREATAYYKRHDLSYSILSVFPSKIESIYFNIPWFYKNKKGNLCMAYQINQVFRKC